MIWSDREGKPIQAHGGGILCDDSVYYWFGENKDLPNSVLPDSVLPDRGDPEAETGVLLERTDVLGISCYSSRNLIHWQNEGIVLPAVPDDPEHDLYPSKVAERPKVIYNARTRQYVMWLHVDTADYTLARTGRAVSDSPTGPYQYIGSFRPEGADSRDMSVFQDADGAAYLYFSSDWNKTLRIVRLSEDYLETTGTVLEAFAGQSREAPAVFRHKDTYFLITSGCTGWEPNAAEYAVSGSPFGPWEVRGNLCVDQGANTTFGGQCTFVLPVAGRPGAFILMLDLWNPQNLRNSRYAWLPLEWKEDALSVSWHDEWDLSFFEAGEGHTSVQIFDGKR